MIAFTNQPTTVMGIGSLAHQNKLIWSCSKLDQLAHSLLINSHSSSFGLECVAKGAGMALVVVGGGGQGAGVDGCIFGLLK